MASILNMSSMIGGAEEVCHMGWVGFKVSDTQARSSVSLSLLAACESRYRTLSSSPAPLTKTEGMQAVFHQSSILNSHIC